MDRPGPLPHDEQLRAVLSFSGPNLPQAAVETLIQLGAQRLQKQYPKR